MEERVEIYIPKGGAKEDPNLFVGINGVNYLLPKGKKVMVPVQVAKLLEQCRKAQEIQDAHMDAMQNEK